MGQQSSFPTQSAGLLFGVKERSDKIMNYFLPGYFIVGLLLAFFYDTWFIALGIGGICVSAYYSIKYLLPASNLYQYVLSVVFGIFMAQFIYQMHGMFEMHFFAFIGCAMMITYQNWKLQLPILTVIVAHHAVFSYLQNTGVSDIYFTQLTDFDLRTFAIHIFLAAVISFICALWAFQLKKYNELQITQAIRISEVQKEAQFNLERRQLSDEKIKILESIGDAFFTVNNNWIVNYWNNTAEKVLKMPRQNILGKNLWDAFTDAIDSESYKQYHRALALNKEVRFEDYFPALKRWYDISAYPTDTGLSVFFKDITERKVSEIQLIESEKRYSDLFDLSPLPIWVFDLNNLYFLDVNAAALKHYGYSRDEFLSMTIKDIRPNTEIAKLYGIPYANGETNLLVKKGIYTHRKKNGELIQVDIQSNNMDYKGKQAKLVIANDVTDRLTYIKAIERKNEKLKEISWIQSHIIRAPLTRIMGLIPLIKDARHTDDDAEKMLDFLAQSANELDSVIRDISDKSSKND